MDYDIKDNFLDKDAFKFIEEQLMGSHFPWFFQPGVVEEGDDGLWTYLAHQFFAENRPQSNYMQLLQPLLDSITPKAIIRAKANCYQRSEKIHQHNFHIDGDYDHNLSILSINTCDGFTVLEDGTKIESKRNRLLTINGSKKHASTTCTNTQNRINIGVNYF
jgi:hypothetical protein